MKTPTINAEVFARLADQKESRLFSRVEIDAITYMAATPFYQSQLPVIVTKPQPYPKRYRDELSGSYETMHDCVRIWLEAYRRNPVELLKLQAIAVRYMKKRPKRTIDTVKTFDLGAYQAGKKMGTDTSSVGKYRKRLLKKVEEYETLK
jgi:hypothetical protein